MNAIVIEVTGQRTSPPLEKIARKCNRRLIVNLRCLATGKRVGDALGAGVESRCKDRMRFVVIFRSAANRGNPKPKPETQNPNNPQQRLPTPERDARRIARAQNVSTFRKEQMGAPQLLFVNNPQKQAGPIQQAGFALLNFTARE